MTAEKAASLTSSLLARKGAAKPAAFDHDVYRPVTLPTGSAGPTAVVTALHPSRDEAAPAVEDADEAPGADEADAAAAGEAAPEAALTDLRVAVEARSGAPDAAAEPDDDGAAPAADAPSAAAAAVEPDDGDAAAQPAEATEPETATADAEPAVDDEAVGVDADADAPADVASDASAAADDGAPQPAADAASDDAPATTPEPAPVAATPPVAVEESLPVVPMAASPADRLAAAPSAAPERRRARTLLLSAAIFIASAVAGWYAVQQSPGLQAEFRQLAGQILTLFYGPAAEVPAKENTGDGADAETAPPASTPSPSTIAPAGRTAPDAATPPVPESDAYDNTVTPAPTPAPPPTDKRDSLAEVAASDTAAPPAVVPDTVVAETAPSIDLVRISPAGDGIIVGRAAPDAELILLDNGEPIGTVTATPAGEWVFQTEEPLPGGEHNFAIVVKKAYGNVTLPSPASRSDDGAPSATAPAAEEQGSRAGDDEDETSAVVPDRPDDAPPLPLSKPGTDVAEAAADGRFVIQLASVRSTAHAERLWAELRQDFPKLTDGLNLIIDSRRGSNAYVRVRTGPFVARANAESYCARFKAGNQDCLVVMALPRS